MINPDISATIWENLYSQGKSLLNYPNSFLVSLSYHLLELQKHRRVLDFGFGSGANLVFLVHRGFEVSGVEVSKSAVEMVRQKLLAENLEADLRTIHNRVIPFDDNSFDAVIAWQVLCYNTWETLKKAIEEIDRVLKPGGLFLGTMAAPGDASHVRSKLLGDSLYESQISGQEGAIILIVGEEELSRCFPGKNIKIGSFNQSYEGLLDSRHWVISYEK
jgi:SAM-dependent methyltransferase